MAGYSLVELIDAFYKEAISEQDYLSGLDQQIQNAQRKLAELDKQKIAPADQALWQEELLPGLQAAYEGVIGAASEAKVYAQERKEEVLHGVGILLASVDKIMEFLALRSGLVSESTQKLMAEALNPHSDGLSLESPVSKGSAESSISFLGE
ncbi:hypothetical protein COW36_20715 [bacterium (Candidatus Blackallbacteria) CG17_big_fil_post_rev_8_21_14_2_50_48_46]|uniref:Uncharacterized protein n=1 Tax=bacterium (Candidatus Blackallbacteria) CG17_big_fil_post_rev_8_21_14_2_50_48_46 TaxID=2014261 RepID=A0A2M7FZ00_9BACT|nr:MAG: hypothetical protein COW64_14025 [bacterium (Candidatus Blackallbacteria) CG18_big_fil_WC_8_21_14_2_50_49_26]PIW14465.1 MAG: hypothetical protein COW36_20715 [bacterium (Candidatus Blackallbacteria) CG17_big_fil_post_rev_8_21_14_2_50_48_46]PIW47151.1 MAG: hypothetical protein COW20_13160 [bacterium (Candidatus Blackallbacteria) CG13_big_fil_rev_8_21_14_2_50_49_14]